MFPARYASRDSSYDVRTGRMEVFSTAARTIPTVSTVNGRARYARKGCWSKTVRNSSAATAASPSRPALNATTGWRSGWASTAASWDARVFQLAATPGRLVLKGYRAKAPHTATTPPKTDCRSRSRPPSRPVLRSSCGRTAPRPGRHHMLQTP